MTDTNSDEGNVGTYYFNDTCTCIYGNLSSSASTEIPVSIKLNNELVAYTYAHLDDVPGASSAAGLSFRRELKFLGTHLGKNDVVSVEYDGKPLSLVATSPQPRVRKESRAEQVLKKIRDGYVCDKYGNLIISMTEDLGWQKSAFSLFESLRKALDEKFSLRLFPTYGTMLGAVRESRFIRQDNDFDTTYVSAHTDPMAVRKEFHRVASFLIESGYLCRLFSTHMHVRVPGDTDSRKLDIFISCLRDDGKYVIPYGWHGEEATASDFDKFVRVKLEDYYIEIPEGHDRILEQLYGPSWRTPDPGFTHKGATRRTDKSYTLSKPVVNSLYWKNFYKYNQVAGGSSFAQFVAPQFAPPATVIEIGCGSGRDSVFFAEHGYRVYACDQADSAIAQATEAASEKGLWSVQFQQVDAASRKQLGAFVSRAIESAGKGPVDSDIIVYMRFFLHSISEKVEDNIFTTIREVIPSPFRIALEFRTSHDAELPKNFKKHYRRFIDSDAFVRQLQDKWGFDIEYYQARTGFSPHEGEDPHLARIVGHSAR